MPVTVYEVHKNSNENEGKSRKRQKTNHTTSTSTLRNLSEFQLFVVENQAETMLCLGATPPRALLASLQICVFPLSCVLSYFLFYFFDPEVIFFHSEVIVDL